MKRRSILITALTLSALIVTGCTYYKVSDPATGKTYYTTSIKKRSGSVEFKDAVTENEVTIQNSEVSKIDKKEFDAAVK